jgi:hypothetical protein
MKNSNDTIGNRTRGLPACSAVPQPTTPPRALPIVRSGLYFIVLVMDSRSRWGGWLTPRPDRFTPGKKNRYPLYRRLGGLQGWSGRVLKISPPPGFDPRTVQLVVSRYTDYAQSLRLHTIVTDFETQIFRNYLSYIVRRIYLSKQKSI